MGTRIRHYGLFVLLLAAIIVIVGGLAFLAGGNPVSPRHELALLPVPSPAPFTQPVEPYPPLDPALIAYLEYGQPDYGIRPLEVLAPGIPPVGAYLPVSGSSQFDFPTPTPTLTRTPIPSRTPIPTTTYTPGPPTATPTSERPATLLALAVTITPATALPRATPVPLREVYTYTGEECAPAGLPTGRSILSQRFHPKHIGIDLVVPIGTAVEATHSGLVEWAGWDMNGYGNLVVIHNGRYITYYAHLSSVSVRRGDAVGKHTLIGLSGSTGNSSGPHVHYEIRIDDVPVDPLTFEARALGTC